MKAYAIQRDIHISARKVGLLCDLIRGKDVTDAKEILSNVDKKSSPIIIKLLDSAISNATHNFSMEPTSLYVYNAIADQGTTIKRTMPRAKGSANMIRKRHCHITITVSDDKNQKKIDIAAAKAKHAGRNKKGAK
jgi:ribosomal protein L22